MKKFVLSAALVLIGGTAFAGDCAGGKCQLAAKSKAVASAPVRTVAKAKSVVREHRPILFPRLRGCR